MTNSRQAHIVTVHYNSPQDILDCWESLAKSDYQNFTWYVVDNASKRSYLKELKNKLNALKAPYMALDSAQFNTKEARIKAKIILVEHPKNEGFAAGNNVVLRYLLKHCKQDLVWLLNPDVIIEPKVLEDLVHQAATKEKALFGNLIHYYNAPSQVMYCGGFYVKKWSHGVRDVKNIVNLKKIDAIAGASLFTRVTSFEELGVLPESYFLYWEETHFCALAKRKGYEFAVNTSSKIFDKVGSAANTNFTREYLYLLNGLRYYHRFYTLRMPIILLSTFAKLIKAIAGPKTKRKAIYYGHIDYFRWAFGGVITIKNRIAKH